MLKFIALLLFIYAFPAYSDESINFVRLGVFTEDPKVTNEAVKAWMQSTGSQKIGNVELGTLTPRGYYFHTSVSTSELAKLIEVLPGRKVFSFERRMPSTQNVQLILTVARELPHYNQDHIRFYQTAKNPKIAIESLRSYLQAMSIQPETFRSANPERLQQLRFQIRPSQLAMIIKLALQSGPLEMREEVAIQNADAPLKVRFVIDKAIAAKKVRTRNETPSYTFHLSTLGEQTHLLKTLNVDEQSQFIIEENKFGPLSLTLAQMGPLLIDTQDSLLPVSEGKFRGQLNILSLFKSPATTPLVKPEPKTAISSVPLTEKPESFSLPLKNVDPKIFLDRDSHTKTYSQNLSLHGFVEPEQNLEPLDQNSSIEPSTEPGQFIWQLKDLKKGVFQERRLRSRSGGKVTDLKYQVYRGPAWNIFGAYGLLPNSRNGQTPIGAGAIQYWFDDTYQRWGLGLQAESILNENPDKLFSPRTRVDLKYRLTAGLQEHDDGFIVSLSNQNIRATKSSHSFLGIGAEYSTTMPRILDLLINWIPFLDYPKRVDLGVFYYPLIFGAQNSVQTNWLYFIEPKMYFTSRFYIFGRVQQSHYKFEASNRKFNSTLFVGYGGFGYLF